MNPINFQPRVTGVSGEPGSLVSRTVVKASSTGTVNVTIRRRLTEVGTAPGRRERTRRAGCATMTGRGPVQEVGVSKHRMEKKVPGLSNRMNIKAKYDRNYDRKYPYKL